MNRFWTASIPIAIIFCFRMLGLFMLIPVFSVLAEKLEYATPVLIGIALGSYGLGQGFLQIPFGLLSDYYGRKPLIAFGLLLLAIGSLLGAWSDSIYGTIIARTIQGMGAIGSVLIALLADLTKEDQRTRAMAVVGMTIGMSFSLAMVLSPIISGYAGLSGIFYFTAFLAFLGLVIVYVCIPDVPMSMEGSSSLTHFELFKQILTIRPLIRLDAGIFFQHMVLTSTFYAVPILLQRQLQEGHLSTTWHFYLPLMLITFLLMIPGIILAEKKKQMRAVFLASIGMAGISQLALALAPQTLTYLSLYLGAYFIAFNILEASLPSLVSKRAPHKGRGTAMGIYSTCQFLGIFAGGVCSGFAYMFWGLQGIFLMNVFICAGWVVMAFTESDYR